MSNDKKLKPIYFLSFLVSYKCTNECKHCALQASPYQNNITIKLTDIRGYLEDVISDFNIQEVGFFGGEPLLDLNLIIELIKEVKKFNILKIGLPTNGFWGKNEIIAKEYAKKLKNAGIYRVGFSADAFHQEFIPLDYLKRAIKATYEAGIEWIGLVTHTLGSENENNKYNLKTKKIIETLSKEFKFLELITSPVQIKGRAVNYLANYYPMTKMPSERCLLLKSPMFMIDPYGWVFHQSCQGICIGNAKKNTLSEILNNYNARKHPIIGKLIVNGGPKNLLDIAIEKGFEPQEGYADNCHFCFSLRNFLRPFYPNILEPSNLYF